VTNAPRCADLAGYPKGRVTVSVENLTSGGPFFVYIQGAPSALFALVPSGGTTTVTFDDVADFGDTLQQAVVINGFYRWIAPITAVDVLPGQTVHAGTLQVSGGGIRPFGGHAPAWRPDGAQIGYIFGDCAGMWGVSPAPPPGLVGDPLLAATNVFACVMDWGPTPALSNQILYWSYLDGGIYRVTAGSSDAGTLLVATDGTENVYDIEWLPDGSGFLFTKTGDFLTNANVYRYDFASGMASPVTQFTNVFARSLAVSPDGQSVVFDLTAAPDSFDSDLIIMDQDGSNQQLLVNNGRLPSWSAGAVQLPSAIYLPFVVH
jgi:TolB protein